MDLKIENVIRGIEEYDVMLKGLYFKYNREYNLQLLVFILVRRDFEFII